MALEMHLHTTDLSKQKLLPKGEGLASRLSSWIAGCEGPTHSPLPSSGSPPTFSLSEEECHLAHPGPKTEVNLQVC